MSLQAAAPAKRDGRCRAVESHNRTKRLRGRDTGYENQLPDGVDEVSSQQMKDDFDCECDAGNHPNDPISDGRIGCQKVANPGSDDEPA